MESNMSQKLESGRFKGKRISDVSSTYLCYLFLCYCRVTATVPERFNKALWSRYQKCIEIPEMHEELSLYMKERNLAILHLLCTMRIDSMMRAILAYQAEYKELLSERRREEEADARANSKKISLSLP